MTPRVTIRLRTVARTVWEAMPARLSSQAVALVPATESTAEITRTSPRATPSPRSRSLSMAKWVAGAGSSKMVRTASRADPSHPRAVTSSPSSAIAPVHPKTPADSRSFASIAPLESLPPVLMSPGIELLSATMTASRSPMLLLITMPAIENATHKPAKMANRPWKARPLARIGPRSFE